MLPAKTFVKGMVAAVVILAMAALLAAGPIGSSKKLSADEELAYLLVKLEKQTRAVISSHFFRMQDGGPDATLEFKDLMIKNRILPAAVADPIFAETVPDATNGRAWVKMVVTDPRNPNNQGDSVALGMLAELQSGKRWVWRDTENAVYYAEPIKCRPDCYNCHGTPAGAPDPYFPEYHKSGWESDDVVGAVVARVEAR